MISVVVVGTGNLATVLFKALLEQEQVKVEQVVGRSMEKLLPFKMHVPVTTYYKDLVPADIYLMAVADAAIPIVAQHLIHVKGVVAHTSGATDILALEPCGRKGVFYPLQTFTKDVDMDFSSVPVCIEAQHKKDELLLKQLAQLVSNRVEKITSAERSILHLSAVYVNNFTNFMFQIGHDLCEAHQLDFSLLLPLMEETVKKAGAILPYKSQTGPAVRADQKTMHAHLGLLQKEEHKAIYILMSNAIKKRYGKEL